jgi:hypothetical protein
MATEYANRSDRTRHGCCSATNGGNGIASLTTAEDHEFGQN